MLFELRDRVGASTFDHLLAAWPQEHRDSNVNRQDYITWFDQAVGHDYSRFFHQWLMSSTTPAL